MTRSTRVTIDPKEAARCLLSGGMVAIPTETVYGLGALATNVEAVGDVFTAKGRPVDHPLIVHVDGLEMARRYGDVEGVAARLATALWPGPLTLIVERTPLVSSVVTGGRETVAIRVPDHPLALAVIKECGEGIVAPSANRFGHVSPTDAQHVISDLGGRIDMVLDGGPCRVGVESTIVDCTNGLQILRPGLVSEDDIERCSGERVAPASGPSRAPGMLISHYAPRARVVLVQSEDLAKEATRRESADGKSVVTVGIGLSAEKYAADLYRLLRRADDAGAECVVAVSPVGGGIAAAVRDRLSKAAADASGRH